MSWRGVQPAACCLCLLLAGPAAAQSFFTDVTREAMPGGLFMVRNTAFGDCDNDGWPDLFLTQHLAGQLALFHNEGNGRFADRTLAIQGELTPKWNGAGSIFGDYDNDGDLDLFVSVGAFAADQAGQNILLRNDRGVLRDVALEAGLIDHLPTDNAIWLDYDRDGYLDLYTGNLACGADDPAAINKLYRNQGNGTFADVTKAAGLALPLDGGCGHGSNGGLAAGDFNDDGWPDLYMGVYEGPNRLFLNDGKGGFRDATTREIGDPGQAYGVAVGDIDNDGDLDFFQAAGGGAGLERSLVLLNLGQGQFLDATEGVGLGGLYAKAVAGVVLGDLDNDGDLDLLVGSPHFLFINDGTGLFTDQTAQSGISDIGWALSLGDYDLDGFLDVVANISGKPGWPLYHNNGNDHHYLQVELVGTRSNRSGIGARLFATAGELHQIREVLGGLGYYQDEMVAHFGLGQHTRVDRLEVRWPSGQVDVLEDIPADQKIRVFEGRTGYHPARPTVWEGRDSLVVGTAHEFTVRFHPALFEPAAQITQVTADLSGLGGPAEVPLAEAGDGTYRFSTSLPATESTGLKPISISIDQATSLGPHWTRLSRSVAVVPAADWLIYDEGNAGEWQEEHHRTVEIADLAYSGEVHAGRVAGLFQVKGSFSGWTIAFQAAVPVEPFGYRLRFAIHPGEVTLPGNARFTVTLIPGKTLSLLDRTWMDMNRQAWQVVEIPVDAFQGPIEAITFSGNFAGTFYLDDIRLVAAAPSPPTVVAEERTAALPQSFALSQNYPNPFNSSTVIRFALPESGEVELAVFNLAGQQVARLVEGVREAGSYTLRWDGRDEQGKELASGVYLCRLRIGEKAETKKLVLVR